MILYEEFEKRWHGTIWIYSDPHFVDKELGDLRKDYVGDEEQVKRINSKVQKGDTIIFLGDIGDLSFIKRIKGYKVLVMGNHEKGASNYKRKIKEINTFNCSDLSIEQAKNILERAEEILKDPNKPENLEYIKYFKPKVIDNHLFDEVYPGPIMVNDRLILSHEPIQPLPCYMFNIHGHDHKNLFNSNNHMNVCAENINYTPVNLINLLKNGLLKNVESIHRVTIDNAIERKKKKQRHLNDSK